MSRSSGGRAQAPPWLCVRAPRARQHAARDPADTQSGDVVEAVGRAGEDRLRGAQAAAYGRPDAFAEITGGETGGLAGDERLVAAARRDAAAQVIAVTGGVIVRAGRQPPLERVGEMLPMGTDVLATLLQPLGDRADADVEPAVLLGHVPGITRQALLEEPQMAVAVAPVVTDFVLERDDLQIAGARVELAEQFAVHGTAGAAGADQIAAAIAVIDHEVRAVGRDVPHVVLLERRS